MHFQIADLLVNLTKHVLVPKLEILTAEEKQKLLKKFNVEAKQVVIVILNLIKMVELLEGHTCYSFSSLLFNVENKLWILVLNY